MAICERMNKALAGRNAEAYLDLYADDAVFVRHQGGTTMDKLQFSDLIRKMMASDKTAMGARRKIYENEDILVVHQRLPRRHTRGGPDGPLCGGRQDHPGRDGRDTAAEMSRD